MRLIATRFSSSLLAIGMFLSSPALHSEIIFEENFDNQEDWHGGMGNVRTSSRIPARGAVIPSKWDFARVDPTWAPSKGYPDRHESLEILASNSDKARGGTGKSMVGWRDSHDPGWLRWNSENLLLKRLGNQTEVYVEFYITFSPETHQSHLNNMLGTSKIFRLYSFSGNWNDPFDYFGGVSHPNLIWSVKGGTTYGVQNKISIYGVGGAAGAPDMPRKAVNSGDYPLSYKTNTTGMAPAGADPQLTDKLNGGIIGPDMEGPALMESVFGPPGSWTKVAFYVKMNSEPGMHDGVLSQWIDDTRILHTERVNWITKTSPGEYWNVLGIGGNDFFQTYSNEERHEEWYAIDDLKVMTKIPDDLNYKPINTSAPNSPMGVTVD
ncbi:hypothetical protein HLV39_02775 [Marinobacter adhaerens]|uniref:Uncharacterized protein n=1 Tax=Marinobacter adhaerens TaxID=1033846 RepID=A0A851HN24_9GAMM|nr:hypothetical protein [Marinobacter adhaerens]NWN90423.1 hypothetical protein [Marinobacter adhaerens]